MMQSRRTFLRSTGLVAAAATLTACTVTTSGKTTTLTLNTTKVKAYAQAGINAVTTILSITAISTAMGAPAVAVIEAAGGALSTALSALLVDLNNVAVAIRAGLVAAQQTVTNSVINTAITTFNALRTVIDAFEGVLGIRLPSVTDEQEATALSVLAAQ